jgi:hypothetical protein
MNRIRVPKTRGGEQPERAICKAKTLLVRVPISWPNTLT